MRQITLNPTGFPLIPMQAILLGASRQAIEARQNPALRRGANVELYRREDGRLFASVTYESTRRNERCYTWVVEADSLDALAAQVRERARDLLPPGAGFPADAQYIDKQDKLRDELQAVALDALTFALSQASLGGVSK